VLADGVVVGRIFKANAAPVGTGMAVEGTRRPNFARAEGYQSAGPSRASQSSCSLPKK